MRLCCNTTFSTRLKKPGLSEDAPQQKLSLFQIRAADATYIAQKQLAEATKQVTITNSRAKNLQDNRDTAQRNAAALILSSLVVDQQTKAHDR